MATMVMRVEVQRVVKIQGVEGWVRRTAGCMRREGGCVEVSWESREEALEVVGRHQPRSHGEEEAREAS